MEAKEKVYYALGHLAYAIAKADGEVQNHEKQMLHKIVQEGVKHHHANLDITAIIFGILEEDRKDRESAYNYAMKEFTRYKSLLKEKHKLDFVQIIEKIAQAFPPVEQEEQAYIERFKKDLQSL